MGPDRGRWIAGLLIAILGVVAGLAAACGSDGVSSAPDATTGATTNDHESTTNDTSPNPQGQGPASDQAGTQGIDHLPQPADDGLRFRVDTDTVRADTADPFLNVRGGPGTDHEVMAKLPPTYTGVRWTGEAETLDDGDLWYLVELVDPVRITPQEPLHGGRPSGWVNATLLQPLPEGLPVTVDEVAACAATGDTSVASTTGESRPEVYALASHHLSPSCLRLVVTYGTGPVTWTWEDITAGTGPASTVPPVHVLSRGASGIVIDLGAADQPWPRATETPRPTVRDGGVTGTEADAYLVRQPDRSLHLWSPVPTRSVAITPVPDRGVVVIDLTVDTDARGPTVTGPHLALTAPPSVGPGSIEVAGIARPFEASLGVSIEDRSGTPVEAVFAGSTHQGTVSTAYYSVSTNDWIDAWGQFAVRAEGLAPGDYTLVLDPGSNEFDERTRIPFSVTRSGPTPTPTLATAQEWATVEPLVALAEGGPANRVPLADEVIVGFGLAEARTVTAAELADPEAWVANTHDFEGFSGDFSALDSLASAPALRVTAGPIDHCAGPPRQWPADLGLGDLRQVNLEPIGIDSCLQWFGVSVFLDDDDQIRAVILDLFGP